MNQAQPLYHKATSAIHSPQVDLDSFVMFLQSFPDKTIRKSEIGKRKIRLKTESLVHQLWKNPITSQNSHQILLLDL